MAARLSDAIQAQDLETGFQPHPAQLVGAAAIMKFMMGGNAIFTLVSKKTGARYTYRIKVVDERRGAVSHFVSLLSGPDNEGDYAYLGQLYSDALDSFKVGQKSHIGHDAPSVKGLQWVIHRVARNLPLDQVEIWHAARCGRCARPLTVPSSIASGFGPECINHV